MLSPLRSCKSGRCGAPLWVRLVMPVLLSGVSRCLIKRSWASLGANLSSAISGLMSSASTPRSVCCSEFSPTAGMLSGGQTGPCRGFRPQAAGGLRQARGAGRCGTA